jgi:hypothetical protein
VARRRLIGCADGFRLVAPRTDCPFRAGRARPSAAQNDAAASKSTGAQNRRYALVWVARAVADGTEEDLYELWHDLEEGRQARIATVIFGSDAGVDDVKRIGAAQNRLVHEVKRRRSLHSHRRRRERRATRTTQVAYRRTRLTLTAPMWAARCKCSAATRTDSTPIVTALAASDLARHSTIADHTHDRSQPKDDGVRRSASSPA